MHSCEKGWSGPNCDECLAHPGCEHGSCQSSPMECVCDPGWMGSLCTCPKCKPGLMQLHIYASSLPYIIVRTIGCNMDHGFCANENGTAECLCHPGWSGPDCDTCIKYPGCPDQGTCDRPWECDCSPDLDNPFCNKNNRISTLPEYHHHEMDASCKELNRQTIPDISRQLGTVPPPVNATWSNWSDWEPCSSTCNDGGITIRMRNCTEEGSGGGLMCEDGTAFDGPVSCNAHIPCGKREASCICLPSFRFVECILHK